MSDEQRDEFGQWDLDLQEFRNCVWELGRHKEHGKLTEEQLRELHERIINARNRLRAARGIPRERVWELLKAAFMAGVPPWAKVGPNRERAIGSAEQEADELLREELGE